MVLQTIRSRWGLALLLGALLAAPFRAAAADPYEINVIIPLTGGGTFLGQAERDALLALEATVNKTGGIDGRPLHFAIADDQSNPSLAVQLTNGLLAKKVPVILGSALTAMCNAQTPLITDGGPVMYCFSGGYHPGSNPYLYGGSVNSRDFIAGGLRYLRLKNWRRVALITSIDSSGQDGERAVDDLLKQPEYASLTLVAREHFNNTDLSVAAQMEHVKAAKPDALFVWTTGTALGTVLRGDKEAGLDALPIVVGSGNATYAQMRQYASFVPKDLLIPAEAVLAPDRVGDRATAAALREMRTAMAPTKPDLLHLTSWDPALLVVTALRKIGPNATAEQLRAFIASQTHFVGGAGPYNFSAVPQRGLDQSAVYMVRWDAPSDTFVGVSKAGGAP
jgi:branched-chain amino acid transport system substrate-binding protein